MLFFENKGSYTRLHLTIVRAQKYENLFEWYAQRLCVEYKPDVASIVKKEF